MLISGLGPVGLCALVVAKAVGGIAVGAGPVKCRRELAARCGASLVLDPVAKPLAGQLDAPGDAVIENSGQRRRADRGDRRHHLPRAHCLRRLGRHRDERRRGADARRTLPDGLQHVHRRRPLRADPDHAPHQPEFRRLRNAPLPLAEGQRAFDRLPPAAPEVLFNWD